MLAFTIFVVFLVGVLSGVILAVSIAAYMADKDRQKAAQKLADDPYMSQIHTQRGIDYHARKL